MIFENINNNRCLPLRIFLNDQKIKIQRGVRIEKSQENITIGEFFQELFPEFFKKNCNNQENKNNFKVLILLFLKKKIKSFCVMELMWT